jgi:transposase
VKCEKTSAGKSYGHSGNKIGNAHLKWAFSEAATMFMRENERAKKFVARREQKYGKGKAMGVLAAKIARSVYQMLRNGEVFDEDLFFAH